MLILISMILLHLIITVYEQIDNYWNMLDDEFDYEVELITNDNIAHMKLTQYYIINTYKI